MYKFDHQLRVLEIKDLLTCRHTHVLTKTNTHTRTER